MTIKPEQWPEEPARVASVGIDTEKIKRIARRYGVASPNLKLIGPTDMTGYNPGAASHLVPVHMGNVAGEAVLPGSVPTLDLAYTEHVVRHRVLKACRDITGQSVPNPAQARTNLRTVPRSRSIKFSVNGAVCQAIPLALRLRSRSSK